MLENLIPSAPSMSTTSPRCCFSLQSTTRLVSAAFFALINISCFAWLCLPPLFFGFTSPTLIEAGGGGPGSSHPVRSIFVVASNFARTTARRSR